MIRFHSQGRDIPPLDGVKVENWLRRITASHDRKLGEINYIFCSDERILEVNRTFLGHDYYTDIITFDYTEGRRVSGDLFISLDTVASNAEGLGIPYEEELSRVLAHGVLHLCGFKDKQPEEAQRMREEEQKALTAKDC